MVVEKFKIHYSCVVNVRQEIWQEILTSYEYNLYTTII
jgi:hypothetical protein